MTALVLSGGGAKGAFQAGAESYLREEGYRWDAIFGVSVGALNAALLGQGRYQELEDLWKGIRRKDVYEGKIGVLTGLKLLFGRKGIYDNRPLRKLIDRYVDPDRFQVPVRVGAVSLLSGKYQTFGPEHPDFKDALWASASIPLAWEPIEGIEDFPAAVDGGVRNNSPLGDVLKEFRPDEVVIINCNPRQVERIGKVSNIVDVGKRTFDLVMNELFVNDVREFLKMNRLVAQARSQGVELTRENGEPYKEFNALVIEPDEPVGSTLDFKPEETIRMWREGRLAARRALNERKLTHAR